MIVALVGSKGGVGKTTLSIHLACEWLDRGRTVAIVDAAGVAGASQWAAQAEARGYGPLPKVLRWQSSQPLNLASVGARYDVVIVDCAGERWAARQASLVAADLAILPTAPTPMDIWGLKEALPEIHQVQLVRRLEARILLTRRLPRTTLNAEVQKLIDGVGIPVLSSTVGFRVEFQRAPAFGIGVTGFEPNSPAADEIRALADEIDGIVRAKRNGPTVAKPRGSEAWDFKRWREWERQTTYEPLHA